VAAAFACGAPASEPSSRAFDLTLPGSAAPVPGVVEVAGDGTLTQKPPQPLSWERDPAQALGRAKREKRPLLIVACAAWATPCVRVDTQMRQAAVVRAMGPYVALRLELDEDTPEINEVVGRFDIKKIPSLILLEPESGRREELDALAPEDVLVETLGRFVTR